MAGFLITGKLQLLTAFFGCFGLVGPYQCSVADQSKYSDEPHPLLVCALVYQLLFNPRESMVAQVWVPIELWVKINSKYVTRFEKTLLMGFFVKIEFDASLISSTIELTHLQVLG